MILLHIFDTPVFHFHPLVYRKLQSPEPESPRDNCIVQTTEWSECSATCGMGISSRVTNDNERCQLERQTRICMIRPCQVHQENIIKVKRLSLTNVT